MEHAYQLSLSSLYCISKMLENVSLDSLEARLYKREDPPLNISILLQDVTELVENVKTYLHDESEDHKAAALYLFSFFTTEVDVEILITAILLSSSDHEKTREASHQLLTNLAEVRSGLIGWVYHSDYRVDIQPSYETT